jgi:hypothetical protein
MQLIDFAHVGQCKSQLLALPDENELLEIGSFIFAITRCSASGRPQKPFPLIEADCLDVDAGQFGQFAGFHGAPHEM